MNHDEIIKVRSERLREFQTASGGGTSGVVPSGMAAFLLAVSPSRIKTLVANGRLATIAQAGQRWILFSSVRKYAEAGERLKVVTSKPDASKADMAKPGASKLYVSKPVVSKPVVSKLAASKPAAFKSVVPKPARSQ